ncbi:hypothetical protein V1Y59_23540 [Gordonia sp. PKS22-38]|uniref:DUF4226 domain-containing protein n=1 Tax=Gordonia prachuapensis TaxID=3115651 RepID=A0ABU7N0H1_9ACTN|nr:hypothetical protein [Gordonia sp. PKS22-38]
MVTFGEVLAFDPEQVAQIFDICRAQEETCASLGDQLKSLDSLRSWDGDAADAARDSAGRQRVDVDAHGTETWKIAAAARDCYNEGVALKRSAQTCEADIAAAGLVVDSTTGKVSDPSPPDMTEWSDADRQAYRDKIDDLQGRVNNVIAAAERFDDDLAAAINAANGSLPLAPDGEGAHVNGADRPANQVAAFRELYGRDPVSVNDWRLAEMLDAHSYDPRYQGEPPVVSVAKIEPVPGQGIVATGLFIPNERVVAGPDFTDPFLEYNDGDGRGFNQNLAPEDTRVSYVVDYENGYVIARQNPSVVSESGEVRTGTPDVKVNQLDDGTVLVDYRAADPFAPAPAAATGWSVNGQTIITPSEDGAEISGRVTDFPSMETYQYMPDGTVNTLHQDDAGDHSSTGPMLNLPFHHEFGDYDDDFDRFPQEMYVSPRDQMPLPTGEVEGGTSLGSPTSPPRVEVSE